MPFPCVTIPYYTLLYHNPNRVDASKSLSHTFRCQEKFQSTFERAYCRSSSIQHAPQASAYKQRLAHPIARTLFLEATQRVSPSSASRVKRATLPTQQRTRHLNPPHDLGPTRVHVYAANTPICLSPDTRPRVSNRFVDS